MAARAKRKRAGTAKVFFSDRHGIFGEKSFSTCAKAKTALRAFLKSSYPGVHGQVVCTSRR